MSNTVTIGETMFKWARDLFPICRSITGPGVRETLVYLQDLLPGLTIESVPSGQQAFDWVVPDEWIIRDAHICDPDGNKVVDFRENNLHVVGYSEPFDRRLSLEELDEHLYSIPDQPNAIPYVTSYYKRRWGFCLTHSQRKLLRPGLYHAVIDSELVPGFLNYGEMILKGSSSQEVMISTNICHPSMANNELSGPVVTTALARWLQSLSNRRYTYRIIFIPETIGSIVYLSRNIKELKERTVAGFQIACIGDDRAYSYLESRDGNTLSDRVARHVLKHVAPDYKSYSFLIDRGSDERQWCSPGVDLPIASIMRSKYAEYPEYHTSLDNLEFVTTSGLEGGFLVFQKVLDCLEHNCVPMLTVYGEPMLSKHSLYPDINAKREDVIDLCNLIAYADGKHDILDLSDLIQKPMWETFPLVEKLHAKRLIELL